MEVQRKAQRKEREPRGGQAKLTSFGGSRAGRCPWRARSSRPASPTRAERDSSTSRKGRLLSCSMKQCLSFMARCVQPMARDVIIYPRRAGQIRNHSRAARPCSIYHRVGVQKVEMAISTLWIGILILLFPRIRCGCQVRPSQSQCLCRASTHKACRARPVSRWMRVPVPPPRRQLTAAAPNSAATSFAAAFCRLVSSSTLKQTDPTQKTGSVCGTRGLNGVFCSHRRCVLRVRPALPDFVAGGPAEQGNNVGGRSLSATDSMN